MTMVGSKPAPCRQRAIIDVVVVLPWVPAMATPYFMRISSPSISARGMTGIFCSSAARISGLSSRMAVLRTTTSAPAMCAGSCLREMRPPSPRRREVAALSFASLPVTA